MADYTVETDLWDLEDDDLDELREVFEEAGILRYFSTSVAALAREKNKRKAIIGGVTQIGDELAIAVDPGWQGSGVGFAMIKALADEGGGGFMVAGTEEGLEFLHSLYWRLTEEEREQFDVPCWDGLEAELEEWEGNPAVLLNPEDVHYFVRDQLEGAMGRAIGAGAKQPLEYVGAGMTSIVFKDARGDAYKTGRWMTCSNIHLLDEEAEWLAVANADEQIGSHVANFYSFDPERLVIVREHVEGRPGAWSQESNLYKLHVRIDRIMRERYGWSAPEFKGDSYIFRDGEPILVDASMAYRHGTNLLTYVQQIINGTRSAYGVTPSDLGFALRIEVADGGISRADAVPLLEALGQPLPA